MNIKNIIEQHIAEDRQREADRRAAMTESERAAEDRQCACDHGVTFDIESAKDLAKQSAYAEIRRRWPRLFGKCPKGCGFNGIGYASYEHYLYGDW